MFLLGAVGGAVGSAVLVYCCIVHRAKQHPPIVTNAPLYEDVVISTTEKQLELKENVAYGRVGSTMQQ